ncbi:hypothetical protein [Trueperella pyogenes]|uniref:hypothetical protein n=1 Tax=Trueperella pyogenes TaxID=1661 RepID=UPI00345D9114
MPPLLPHGQTCVLILSESTTGGKPSPTQTPKHRTTYALPAANLYYRHTDRLYVCPACECAGTLEHAHNTAMWRIKTSDLWIDRKTACTVFGLARAALWKRIARGMVECDRDGRGRLQSMW